MKFSCFAGEKIALFGLGASGLAAARALQAGGAKLAVWDDSVPAVAKARAAGLAAQDLRKADWSGIKALVLSPGVPLTNPKPHWSAALARQAGAEIIGDIELFFRERARQNSRAPVIAVTGTNGKSTATALTAHLLQAAGCDAQTGGNIGKPVAELAPFAAAGGKQVYVLELSSYQIDLTPSLAPDAGILLNITPDHIDRHGSFARYAAVKERLAAAARTAIIVTDDAPCRGICARLKQAGHKLVCVSAEHYAHDGSGGRDCVSAHYACRAGVFWRGGALLPASRALAGRHNALNALCALEACAAIGASGFEAGLKSFKGLPHRMEDAGEMRHKGVKIRFVNDSKATNAEAALPALQSFNNIYWLAGGRAKAGGIKTLLTAESLAHLRGAYFFGEAGGEFAADFAKTACAEHIPQRRAADMAAAFAAAKAQAEADIDRGKISGEAVILLSPACASFDRFKNFEERGAAFRALAKQYEAMRQKQP